MKINIFLMMMLGSMPLLLEAKSGQTLFQERCMICHMKDKPTPQNRSEMYAPPVMGIMFKIKEAFKGDKKAALTYMRGYAVGPSAKKAKWVAAVKRYGLMPTLRGTITAQDLGLITEYMYDTFPTSEFEESDLEKML
jgi:hypothetical protein